MSNSDSPETRWAATIPRREDAVTLAEWLAVFDGLEQFLTTMIGRRRDSDPKEELLRWRTEVRQARALVRQSPKHVTFANLITKIYVFDAEFYRLMPNQQRSQMRARATPTEEPRSRRATPRSGPRRRAWTLTIPIAPRRPRPDDSRASSNSAHARFNASSAESRDTR